MNLLAFNFKFYPANAFFRYFYEVAFFVSSVGNYYKVVIFKEIFVDKIAYSVLAANFLISDHAEAYFILGNNIVLLKGNCCIK